MKQRISQLLTIKSIVTIVLSVVFSYLAITEKVKADLFMTIYTMVIGFYFGTQHDKQTK